MSRTNIPPARFAVSIVIPTFNGARRLPQVFDALALQTLPGEMCEVLVVNNASTDDTARIVNEHPSVARLVSHGFSCRTIYESRQGLTHARIAGLSAADSGLVCFLDDDNVPDPDYLRNATDLFNDSSIALAVSSVRPEWECQPARSIQRRQHLLAVNQYLGVEARDFKVPPLLAPTIGAGMWVRRNAFFDAVPYHQLDRLLPDRVGNSLVCGGDIEIGILIGKAGYRRVYAPTLRMVHLIPRRRLTVSYVCKLICGIVRSELTLRERYCEQTYGAYDRLNALARMFTTMLGMPAIAMLREDGLREAIFIAADRWARIRGPLRRFA